jgi:hypothetical protein
MESREETKRRRVIVHEISEQWQKYGIGKRISRHARTRSQERGSTGASDINGMGYEASVSATATNTANAHEGRQRWVESYGREVNYEN